MDPNPAQEIEAIDTPKFDIQNQEVGLEARRVELTGESLRRKWNKKDTEDKE